MITENDILETLTFWESEEKTKEGNKWIGVKESNYSDVAKQIINKLIISQIKNNLENDR